MKSMWMPMMALGASFAFGLKTTLRGEAPYPKAEKMAQAEIETFDYIVVGAGNVGAVIASRLSDNPDIRVLLLEEGIYSQDSEGGRRSDYLANSITTPRFDFRTWVSPSLTHVLYSENNPGLGNRGGVSCGPVISGKGLGGSTIVNIGAYTRPAMEYFDSLGLEEWTWDNVLPYFKQVENHEKNGPDYGKTGPLRVEHGDAQSMYPMLYDASMAVDPPLMSYSNGEEKPGIPLVYRAITHGKREDSYTSYLKPHLDRPNLVIRTGARVQKVVIEDKTATGVIYINVVGGDVNTEVQVAASKEVILSAGAFFSPAILLLSGIGPEKELQQMRIPVVVDSPAVGKYLETRSNIGLLISNGTRAPEMARSTFRGDEYRNQWVETGLGPFSLAPLGTYAVMKNSANKSDTGYIIFSTSVVPDLLGRAMSLGCANLAVNEPGWVRLNPRDIHGPPLVHLNMMGSDVDRAAVKTCLRDLRAMINSEPMKKQHFVEVFPGERNFPTTDAGLERLISFAGFYSWHVTSSAKMGKDDDSNSVLDSRLRVKGIKNLRVADASSFPKMIEAGPMGALYMMGEKAAALLKADNGHE